MAEKMAQLDGLIQMEDSMDENQSTHDEESNDSEESNNSEENNDSEESSDSEESNDSTTAGWHTEFCSFKQQTDEKFEVQGKAIHNLEQLIQDSDKIREIQTNKFTSKTIEVLKDFKKKMSRKLSELRTEQKRHGEILDDIPAIKSQLENIQQGSQVSQETQAHPGIWLQLVPSQIDMLKEQMKEKQE